MFPAEIDNVGALAVKRAHASDEQYIQGEPLVDDICLVLVNEGEEVPEGYVSLERISAQKDGSRSAKSAQGLSRIVLAYHQRPAMGLCDLSYESATLDRYPQKVLHKLSIAEFSFDRSVITFSLANSLNEKLTTQFHLLTIFCALQIYFRTNVNSHCQ